MSDSGEPYDPRGIANLILDLAAQEERGVTNLALQKLLYFTYALHLIETKKPLFAGYFEAWKFGPVHPVAYRAFKASENREIDFRAFRENLITGQKMPINQNISVETKNRVSKIISSYGRMTPGRLVEISHARGAPWEFIVNKASTAMAFGMRIPDDVILQRFKYHKVTLGAKPRHGEPSEDTPFT